MRGQVLYGSLTTALGLLGMILACRSGGLALACVPFAVVVLAINLPCALLDLRGALRRELAVSAPPLRA
jgi:hypothetical protein